MTSNSRKIARSICALVVAYATIFFYSLPVLAQDASNPASGQNNNGTGESAGGSLTEAKNFQEFVQVFYNYLATITIVAALLSGIIGAYIYMSSSGNPEKTNTAKTMITNSIIALIVVAFSYAFFRILAPGIIRAGS